jgi:hypothetical protein
LAVLRGADLVTTFGQYIEQQLDVLWRIVDNKDAPWQDVVEMAHPLLSGLLPGLSGKVTRNWLPRPTVLSTSTRPCIGVTNCRTMVVPNPVPP